MLSFFSLSIPSTKSRDPRSTHAATCMYFFLLLLFRMHLLLVLFYIFQPHECFCLKFLPVVRMLFTKIIGSYYNFFSFSKRQRQRRQRAAAMVHTSSEPACVSADLSQSDRPISVSFLVWLITLI